MGRLTSGNLTRALAQFAHGMTLEHTTMINADSTPQRFKVTSVKTWKRNPARIELGYKRGMYEFGTIDAAHLDQFNLSARDLAHCTMRASGWSTWSFRSIRADGAYTWSTGWISADQAVRKIGNARVYGMPETNFSSCGHARVEQVDRLNPYPKLCAACGAWY